MTTANASYTVIRTVPNPSMMNRYSYVAGNPIDRWDPSGRQYCTSMCGVEATGRVVQDIGDNLWPDKIDMEKAGKNCLKGGAAGAVGGTVAVGAAALAGPVGAGAAATTIGAATVGGCAGKATEGILEDLF